MIDIDLRRRTDEATLAMIKDMNERFYGDDNAFAVKARPLSVRERLSTFGERAKNAWLVLTGKLDPYDQW